MLPPFELAGRLPAGVHSATWLAFVERFGTSAHRREQAAKLEAALRLLRGAGCPRVFVGGSFVTTKSEPGDVDVVWDTTGVDAEALDAIFFDFGDERAAQKQRFGGEFSRLNSWKGSQVDRFSGSFNTRA